MNDNHNRPWSPVEATKKGHAAHQAREQAVIDMLEMSDVLAEANRAVKRGRAEAYAQLRALSGPDTPRNAEERKAWVEDRVADLEFAYDLADQGYKNQRQVINMHADQIGWCRTLMASHRGVDA